MTYEKGDAEAATTMVPGSATAWTDPAVTPLQAVPMSATVIPKIVLRTFQVPRTQDRPALGRAP